MLWIKALHIISIVTWFAALFYLPRLFVYHAMAEAEGGDLAGIERFKTMERKLYRGIMNPSMVVANGLGLWLLYDYGWAIYASMGWLHTKIALVAILIAYHLYCGKLMRSFAADENRHSHLFYRWFNEFPVTILVAVVILAIVKPF